MPAVYELHALGICKGIFTSFVRESFECFIEGFCEEYMFIRMFLNIIMNILPKFAYELLYSRTEVI